jgi:hypothetical protein
MIKETTKVYYSETEYLIMETFTLEKKEKKASKKVWIPEIKSFDPVDIEKKIELGGVHLIGAFDSIFQKLKQDYDVYHYILPSLPKEIEKYLIKDIANIVNGYAQMTDLENDGDEISHSIYNTKIQYNPNPRKNMRMIIDDALDVGLHSCGSKYRFIKKIEYEEYGIYTPHKKNKTCGKHDGIRYSITNDAQRQLRLLFSIAFP